MDNTKTIELRRQLTDDYFMVMKLNSSNLYIKDIINKFNFDDYYCLKFTRQQILLSYEDFVNLKYSGYTFFKKDRYNIDNIKYWINFFIEVGGFKYLSKPTPPFNPFNKLIIKK